MKRTIVGASLLSLVLALLAPAAALACPGNGAHRGSSIQVSNGGGGGQGDHKGGKHKKKKKHKKHKKHGQRGTRGGSGKS